MRPGKAMQRLQDTEWRAGAAGAGARLGCVQCPWACCFSLQAKHLTRFCLRPYVEFF